MNALKVAAIIEARMRSSRLPGKLMLPIVEKPALAHLFERLRRCKKLDDIILATTETPCDVVLADFAQRQDVNFFRGSENDVMSRVLYAAREFDVDVIVEITSDCPLVDTAMVDAAIDQFFTGKLEYLSNVIKRTYPRGLDVQIFTRTALERTFESTGDPVDREHVSLFIYEHPEIFRLGHFGCEGTRLEWPEQRITLDTPEDYFVIRSVFENLYPENPEFGYADIHGFLQENPDIAAINMEIVQKRARGYDFTLKARQALGLE